MRAKPYVIPGSHPCDCAAAAIRLKGIDHSRVDPLPMIHKFVVHSRFPGNTVPALALNGERLVGGAPAGARRVLASGRGVPRAGA